MESVSGHVVVVSGEPEFTNNSGLFNDRGFLNIEGLSWELRFREI